MHQSNAAWSAGPGAKDSSQAIYLRASSILGCDVRHMAESLGHMHPGGASADYIATPQTMTMFGFGRSPAGTAPCHIPKSHAWPLLLLSLHLPHQVLWHGQGSSCVCMLRRQRYSSPTWAAAACQMRSPAIDTRHACKIGAMAKTPSMVSCQTPEHCARRYLRGMSALTQAFSMSGQSSTWWRFPCSAAGLYHCPGRSTGCSGQ